MVNLISSEFLKMKGSFSKNLIFIGPLFTLALGYVLSGNLVQLTAYNWWYTMILPVIVSVWGTSIIRREENTQYQNILCLPVNIRKTWISKIFTLFMLLFITGLIMFLGGMFFGTFTIMNISLINGFIGNILLCISYLWQIPLLMLGTKFIGDMPTFLLSIVGNLFLSLLGAETKWFLINPFAIPARVVCPFFKMHPNGLIIENESYLLDKSIIIPSISISLIVAGILFILTTLIFVRGVEKHD